MFFSRTIEAVVQKCIDDDEHDDDVTSLHKTHLWGLLTSYWMEKSEGDL